VATAEVIAAAVEVMRAAGLEPLDPYPGTGKPWRSRCVTCQRDVSPTLASVKRGAGCKYCAGKAVVPEEAVQVMRAANLEPLTPFPGANKSWPCTCTTCGREVSPSYGAVRTGGSCRYCAGNAVVPDEAAAHMRSIGLEPVEPYPGTYPPWRCRCLVCGREVSPTYGAVRAGRSNGCRYCRGRTVDPDDAAAKMRAAGVEPLEPYRGKDEPWRCRCLTCDREVTPNYGNIRRGQSACKWCAGKVVDRDEAVAFMLGAGFEPLEPYPGANTLWMCRCEKCGTEFGVRYTGIKSGKGCRYCAGQVVDQVEAVAIMNAAGFEPLVPYPGSNEPWPCRCATCGREPSPSLASVRDGKKCKYCAGKAVVPDEAVAFMLERGFEMLEPYPGAHQRWRCRCLTCQRVFTTNYTNVRTGGGCRYCAKQEVMPEEAVEAMLAAGYEPLVPYPGGNNRWLCRCMRCGRETNPTYTGTMTGRRCRFCAAYGIDYTAPGVVYLLRNDDWYALKIGITASTRYSRIEQHEKHGWKSVATWPVATGDLAEQIENAVLLWWRVDLEAPVALTKEQMRQGGWSETASLMWVDVDHTVEYVDRLVATIDQPHPATTQPT
jgi:DNA-directed RNA polymerase subunit RPC12/RpoP